MTRPDFDDELTRALREMAAEIPDDARLGPEFWRRLEHRRRRPAWLAGHRAGALVTALALVAIIATTVLVLRPSPAPAPPATPSITSPAPTPSSTASPTVPCQPGPRVEPTRTPSAAGDQLQFDSAPATQPAPWIPKDAVPIRSSTFTTITEVGGCIQAWKLPAGSTVPNDTTTVPDTRVDATTRINQAGLTEVYLTDSGATFLAVSADTSAGDLAAVLQAAVTRP